MTRRDFLKTSALASLGLVAGCMRKSSPGVIFKGWPYEPDLVRQNIEFFKQQTNIKVTYEAVSGHYHDKMVALFVGETPMDCCYVRDDDFAEWVEAGWLHPYDDLPGAGDTSDDIFAYNLESMTYEGKHYGLPYYTDFSIWIYNEKMLEAASFEHPARTLDELTEQAIKIKEQRLRTPDGAVIKYPIVLGFRQAVTGFNDWWTLNYASEVDLFNDELNPIFPDEPLSNLDAKLRVTMCTELKRLHAELEKTFVYVTHDQAEPLIMSDRIAVLNAGELQQLGTPEEIYNHPANVFIAGFVGSPPMNFFHGVLQNDAGQQWQVKGEGFVCELTPKTAQQLVTNAPAEVRLGIRPEDVEISSADSPTTHATVVVREPLGSDLFLTLEVNGTTFKARTRPDARFDHGECIAIRFVPTKVHLFEQTTGKTLLEPG